MPAIVRALPDHFAPDVPDAVQDDFARHASWAVSEGDEVVGSTVADRRALARDGVRLVEAKTLDRSAGYAPYEGTNAFWESLGFVQIATIDPLPGWRPGNPSAVYVAALGSTRG
ncbi:hypothetical protein [Nonomuraea aridisoli]|uniref:Uncharacterized protein n=1 Tax=Nonomuraea aridisoli TaxID=2070368 RepID=A0A2W2CZS0_9ACTN|nr:hypothetical protein [Nonomuraea aridisoli]PZG05046.1 hypothetical protein C1J01_43920 [Nonomuraea aridisoli]